MPIDHDNDLDKPDQECGLRLKSIRERLHLTQKEFGKKMGVSNTLISQIETGERSLSNSFIKKIAEVLNINPTWLLLGQGPYHLNQYLSDKSNPAMLISAPEPELESLIWYCLNSQMVKFNVLGYFFKFLRQNKPIIDEEIQDKSSKEREKKNNGKEGF